MRLLTVMNCPSSVKGGMPTANANLSAALRAKGWEIDHIYLDDLNQWVARPPLNYLAFAPIVQRAIRNAERGRTPFDVIQFSGGEGWLSSQLRFGPAGRRLVVAKCHGLEHRLWSAFLGEVEAKHERVTLQHRLYFGRLRLAQVQRSIALADLFVCHTEADARYVLERRWTTAERVAVIGEGVNPGWIREPIEPKAPTHRILWSGTWNWMKGRHVLPRVLAGIHRIDERVRLTLIGTGLDQAAVHLDFPESLRDLVTVHPGVPHERVRELFRSHDALLATSVFEGHGTVVIEAMAAGIPVIATAAGAWPEHVHDEVTGFAAKANDPDSFLRAWQRLLTTSPAELLSLRLRARKAISEATWDQIAQKTADLYEDALNRVRAMQPAHTLQV